MTLSLVKLHWKTLNLWSHPSHIVFNPNPRPSGDVSDDDHETDEDSSEEDDETRSRGSRASNKGGTRRSSRKADRPAKSVKLTPGDSDAVGYIFTPPYCTLFILLLFL